MPFMRVPVVEGVIDRRILVNYRVDPETLTHALPAPFEPKLVREKGIAGICLIRLKAIRPLGLPGWLGISSENAAHRIAVQWRANGQVHGGVYVPRRDSSSRLNRILGGRLFPGLHHQARFEVEERLDDLRVALDATDGSVHLRVEARRVEELPATSIFENLEEASSFFEEGSLGYSPSRRAGEYDGLELRTSEWRVEPLEVGTVRSSFFEDQDLFPPGSIEFDCALLMRGIQHEWHGKQSLYCDIPR